MTSMSTALKTFDWSEPDYKPILQERVRRLKAIREDPDTLAAHLKIYKDDPVAFIRDWGFTYDPRREGLKFMPFILFDRQVKYIEWLLKHFEEQSDGLCEKSRDMGASWLCIAFAWWAYRFRGSVSISFGSRKEMLVDRLGDPDSLFEKLRLFYKRLPKLFLPKGFKAKDHDSFLRIQNPETGASITGEAGDNIGRGGRSTMYFVDEFAHIPRAEAVLSALEDNSDCKLYLSSVNGVGNAFYRIRHSGEYDVFVFDWRDNPMKTQEWYDAECRKRDPVTIAKELDRDYEAAVENVCIPGRWVRSALEPEMAAIEASRVGIAGLDIGGGGADASVFLTRNGPYVDNIEAWGDGDTTATAHKAANLCRKHKAKQLYFDSVGVGAGVGSTLKRIKGVSSKGINVGNKPTKRRWPDGKRSDEKFRNLKAELWFVMRERFRKTFEHVNYLRGIEGGERHPEDELISLPDCQDLVRELSSVRWFFTETGKIRMESKDELKRRGIKSPDHADALALTFIEKPAGGGLKKLEGFY